MHGAEACDVVELVEQGERQDLAHTRSCPQALEGFRVVDLDLGSDPTLEPRMTLS